MKLFLVFAALCTSAKAEDLLDSALDADNECLASSNPEACGLSALQLKARKSSIKAHRSALRDDPDDGMNPTTPCDGSADFPSTQACYAGSVMGGLETFAVKFHTDTGLVDITADGAMPGLLKGVIYSKSGQSISADLNAAFANQVTIDGLTFCSQSNQLRVSVTSPMQVVVALNSVDCSSVSLLTAASVSYNLARRFQSAQAPSCTGTGDLPSKPTCFSGAVLGGLETFNVKVHSYSGGKGLMDVVADGAMPGEKSGLTFSKAGSVVHVANLEDALNGLVTVSGVQYCSTEKQLVVSVSSPMAMDVELPEVPCAAFLQQEQTPTPYFSCTGTGEMPSKPTCYSAKAMGGMETFYLKVHGYHQGKGEVDVIANGAMNGIRLAMPFTKAGNAIQAPGIDGALNNLCKVSDIEYCPTERSVIVTISSPMKYSIALPQVECLTLLEEQELVKKHEMEERDDPPPACGGSGDLPSAATCFTGMVMGGLETFNVKVHSYQNGKGLMDVVGDGLVPGQKIAMPFTTAGAAIQIPDIDAALNNLVTVSSVSYCPAQQSLLVSISSPMEMSVSLSTTDCATAVAPSLVQGLQTPTPYFSCTGTAEMPSKPACYSAKVMGGMETFYLKVYGYHQGKGEVDVIANGAMNGIRMAMPFTKAGNAIQAPGIDAALNNLCKVSDIQYCSTERSVIVTISSPMKYSIALPQVECLTLLEEQELVKKHKAEERDDPPPDCGGSGDLPSAATCFTGMVMGGLETFNVKVHGYTHGKGLIDVVGDGLVPGQKFKMPFTTAGAAIQIPDIDAALNNLVTVSSVSYCPTQQSLLVSISSPMEMSVSLSKTDCATAVAPSLVQTTQLFGDSMNPTTPCRGSDDLPTQQTCFARMVMAGLQTLSVKLDYENGQGVADFMADGMIPGQLLGTPFTKIGQELLTTGLNKALGSKAEIGSIQYCSALNQLRVSVAKPTPMTFALNSVDCSGVSLVQAAFKQRRQEPESMNPTTPCAGSGAFPVSKICFSGTVLGGLETFTVTLKSTSDGQGTYDIVATGAMPGELKGSLFSKLGQTITAQGLNAAFQGQGVEIGGIQYCSSLDQLRVTVTSPMEVVVALNRADCV